MADLRKFAATSNIVRFVLTNSSTGMGLTGLSSTSSGLIISTVADNEATATVYTVAASHLQTIATLGTFAAPSASNCRFAEVDATNHKGLYEFQFADARFAVSSSKRLVISVTGAASLLDTNYEIELVQFDPFDAVHLGLSALPNTACTTNASLITSGTGTDQLSVASGRIDIGKALGTAITLDANNVLNVSTKYWAGTAITATSLPVATAAGASGGLLISGSNAGTTTFAALTVSGATTLTGAVSLGSTLAVTGAVTFTAGLTSNITGTLSTVTTVTTTTNVTNAPTAGDFTATMKTSLGTAVGTAQTGDSFARIGATGSGLTSLAPSATALSTANYTTTRAGYLDNLSAGAVALASGVNTTKFGGQTITCAAAVTVNPNVGTTQPVNFTGTAGSALVKSDMTDIAGSAVSASTAQLGVNVVNFGGSAGTFTTGIPSVNTTQFLGNAVVLDVNNYPGVNIVDVAGSAASAVSGNIPADVQTIKTQTVTCAGAVTVNGNVGTTQPVNFTGTSTSALIKSDMIDIASAAVSTSSAQIGVNAVNVGGTAQTGRDLGASVLLSTGTGTGQLDFTSGVVKANLAQILGTALTETAGQIAAAFKKFFNIATPTSTMNEITLVDTVTTTTTATTATNLTNAATAGDLTATMKASIATALATGVNVTEVNGSTTAATNLGLEMLAMIVASVNDGSPGATTFIGSSGLSATDNEYAGLILAFTSGTHTGVSRKIASYVGSTKSITLSAALPSAPANTNNFIILGLG